MMPRGAPTGKLYRLDAGGLAAMDSGTAITNGPAFSPDGGTLYHTDTLGKTIYAFDTGEDGALRNKRVFVKIEDGAGHPDGPVVDAQGCLWTGLFGGWAVRRYAPDGALLETVSFPVAHVTKLAFGGSDLTTVYATTASKGLDKAALAKQPLAGGLFRFTADYAGPAAKQHRVSRALTTRLSARRDRPESRVRHNRNSRSPRKSRCPPCPGRPCRRTRP